MDELLEGLGTLTLKEVYLNIHGALAMASLILFGALIALILLWKKNPNLTDKIKKLWAWQLATITSLYLMGLFVYIPYRGKGGAKYTLVANHETAWLHEIVFEHKEFLALAPLILAVVGLWITWKLGRDKANAPTVRNIGLFCAIAGLVLLLLVAAEAVLVTKVAPVR